MNETTRDFQQIRKSFSEVHRILLMINTGRLANSTEGNTLLEQSTIIIAWSMIGVGVFGLCTNLLTILVRLEPKMHSSVNVLMIALAFADTGVEVFGTVAFLPEGLYPYVNRTSALEGLRAHSFTWISPVATVFRTVSTYLLVFMTLERYWAICRPFSAFHLCSTRNSCIGIAVICAASVVYNIPRMLEYKLNPSEAVGFTKVSTKVLGIHYHEIYEIWLYPLVMFGIPFFLLILGNAKIVWEIRASTFRRSQISRSTVQEHEDKVATRMLCLITLVFLVTNTLPFAIRIYDTVFREETARLVRERTEKIARNRAAFPRFKRLWDLKEDLVTRIIREERMEEFPTEAMAFLTVLSNTLVLINSAINVTIYFWCSEKFREALRQKTQCAAQYPPVFV